MQLKAMNTFMKERSWMNRVASEIVSAFHPDTGASLHDEGVIASFCISILPARCH